MRTLTLLLLLVAVQTTGSQAQIPPKRTTAVAAGSSENRLLVSTLAVDGIEAAAAVAVSDGLRRRFAQLSSGRYQVLSREAVNSALAQFGYAADDILPLAAVQVLAGQLKAAFVVAGKVEAAEAGRVRASASFARRDGSGRTEIAGAQDAGQSPEAFGAALAERLYASIR
jgi:hypothetical protein